MKRQTKRPHVRRAADRRRARFHPGSRAEAIATGDYRETTAEREKRQTAQRLQREVRLERRIQRLTRQLRGAIARTERSVRDLVYDVALREGFVIMTAAEASAADDGEALDEFTKATATAAGAFGANG